MVDVNWLLEQLEDLCVMSINLQTLNVSSCVKLVRMQLKCPTLASLDFSLCGRSISTWEHNILHSTPIPYMLLPAKFGLVSVSLKLLYLTLKGRRGSMYDIYMRFLQASPSLIFNSFKFWGFETLFSTLCYVLSYLKDKINIYSYVALMTKYKVYVCIQGH